MLSALAQFQRKLIVANPNDGLAADARPAAVSTGATGRARAAVPGASGDAARTSPRDLTASRALAAT